jgi:general secretion pathway protein J
MTDGHGSRGTTKRGAGDDAGFTLVEFLVALALFSVLVTLLFDNVRFGLSAWQRGSARAEHFEHTMISQDLLRRLMSNIYPMFVAADGTEARIDFEGTKEAVSFLSSAPIVASSGGRFRFKLFIERKQNQTDLVMSTTPELASPPDPAAGIRTPLLSDIDRVEFSYSGGVTAGRTAQWIDNWTKRSDLPRLIRIRVAFRSEDERQWPELLVAPGIAVDVSCIYDPITKQCRGR